MFVAAAVRPPALVARALVCFGGCCCRRVRLRVCACAGGECDRVRPAGVSPGGEEAVGSAAAAAVPRVLLLVLRVMCRSVRVKGPNSNPAFRRSNTASDRRVLLDGLMNGISPPLGSIACCRRAAGTKQRSHAAKQEKHTSKMCRRYRTKAPKQRRSTARRVKIKISPIDLQLTRPSTTS